MGGQRCPTWCQSKAPAPEGQRFSWRNFLRIGSWCLNGAYIGAPDVQLSQNLAHHCTHIYIIFTHIISRIDPLGSLDADWTTARPAVRIAIFRGAFFGVDHQEALEFELHPEAGWQHQLHR